ncbi:hypothetical protein [uncultured Parabacteroides sp.]|uniref:hypothetical protein n=1 Tax=uncultured Parabacteroides sp. TaxID=512312 RepID=UPI0025E5D86D|nr:hypothetical protein [uncultured Parabacteroides sp.]
MEPIRRLIFRFPAALFHDDRLHSGDDRFRCSEVRGSACMKTVVMAMKTVVMGIFCAPHGKHPRK